MTKPFSSDMHNPTAILPIQFYMDPFATSSHSYKGHLWHARRARAAANGCDKDLDRQAEPTLAMPDLD